MSNTREEIQKLIEADDTLFCDASDYRNIKSNIETQFKELIFKDLGIQDNPKRQALYDIAWDLGHDYGFNEIYNHAISLAILIK